jgi:hypothetical protein
LSAVRRSMRAAWISPDRRQRRRPSAMSAPVDPARAAARMQPRPGDAVETAARAASIAAAAGGGSGEGDGGAWQWYGGAARSQASSNGPRWRMSDWPMSAAARIVGSRAGDMRDGRSTMTLRINCCMRRSTSRTSRCWGCIAVAGGAP